MAAQGQYSKMLQDGIITYVNKHGELANTALRGIKNPRPKHIIENWNPLSLVILDYYKFDNCNPMVDVFGGSNSKFNRFDQERQTQRGRFEKLVELEKGNLRRKWGETLSDDEGGDDYNHKKGEEIP